MIDPFDEYDADETDNDDWGTQRTFGTFFGFDVKDDGARDHDLYIVIDGERSLSPLSTLRRKLGDKAFEQMLTDLEDAVNEHVADDGSVERSAPSESGGGSVFDRPPVEFKCTGCNESFPRTMDAGNNRCPDCANQD